MCVRFYESVEEDCPSVTSLGANVVPPQCWWTAPFLLAPGVQAWSVLPITREANCAFMDFSEGRLAWITMRLSDLRCLGSLLEWTGISF